MLAAAGQRVTRCCAMTMSCHSSVRLQLCVCCAACGAQQNRLARPCFLASSQQQSNASACTVAAAAACIIIVLLARLDGQAARLAVAAKPGRMFPPGVHCLWSLWHTPCPTPWPVAICAAEDALSICCVRCAVCVCVQRVSSGCKLFPLFIFSFAQLAYAMAMVCCAACCC